MPRSLTRASPGSAVILSTVMLLAVIVTTTCQLRPGVARDMRTYTTGTLPLFATYSRSRVTHDVTVT